VGYKKHTLRLWLSQYERGVLLVPLVSWAAPANHSEGCLLRPSLHYCQRRFDWCPQVVVGDMGYLDAATKQLARQRWHVAVVTRLREGMLLVPPFESPTRTVCPQGQRLQWLGYDAEEQRHWFGVREAQPLCGCCWQARECDREFSFAAADHETLLGLLPMSTRVTQRLLRQVRPWIEPSQSYEKNQLGLSQIFLNSLRLAWLMCLLADAAVLLRARALLCEPVAPPPLLDGLLPLQFQLDLGE
jgi:hypothetical protein